MVNLEDALTCSFVKVCVTEMRVKVTIMTVFDKNHDLSLARKMWDTLDNRTPLRGVSMSVRIRMSCWTCQTCPLNVLSALNLSRMECLKLCIVQPDTIGLRSPKGKPLKRNWRGCVQSECRKSLEELWQRNLCRQKAIHGATKAGMCAFAKGLVRWSRSANIKAIGRGAVTDIVIGRGLNSHHCLTFWNI